MNIFNYLFLYIRSELDNKIEVRFNLKVKLQILGNCHDINNNNTKNIQIVYNFTYMYIYIFFFRWKNKNKK